MPPTTGLTWCRSWRRGEDPAAVGSARTLILLRRACTFVTTRTTLLNGSRSWLRRAAAAGGGGPLAVSAGGTLTNTVAASAGGTRRHPNKPQLANSKPRLHTRTNIAARPGTTVQKMPFSLTEELRGALQRERATRGPRACGRLPYTWRLAVNRACRTLSAADLQAVARTSLIVARFHATGRRLLVQAGGETAQEPAAPFVWKPSPDAAPEQHAKQLSEAEAWLITVVAASLAFKMDCDRVEDASYLLETVVRRTPPPPGVIAANVNGAVPLHDEEDADDEDDVVGLAHELAQSLYEAGFGPPQRARSAATNKPHGVATHGFSGMVQGIRRALRLGPKDLDRSLPAAAPEPAQTPPPPEAASHADPAPLPLWLLTSLARAEFVVADALEWRLAFPTVLDALENLVPGSTWDGGGPSGEAIFIAGEVVCAGDHGLSARQLAAAVLLGERFGRAQQAT